MARSHAHGNHCLIPGGVRAGGGSLADGCEPAPTCTCSQRPAELMELQLEGPGMILLCQADATAQCAVVPFMLYKFTINLQLACSHSVFESFAF